MVNNLKQLQLKKVYRSYFDKIYEDFLRRALEVAIDYRRGVGFFSIEALYLIISGLLPIVKAKGRIRIITSPKLMESDVESLKIQSEPEEESNIIRNLENAITINDNDAEKVNILRLITKLIKNGDIEIRIAYSKDGIFHEKIGIITDYEENNISFYGSLNDTYSAYNRNLESIKLSFSWEDEETTNDDLLYFEKLWNGEYPNIRVLSLPDTIKENLYESYSSEDITYEELFSRVENRESNIETNKRELYDFQTAAINEFFIYRKSHFFQMATGTGKTYTTIKLIQKLTKLMDVFIVILVPQIDLQDQWVTQFHKEGISNVIRLGGKGEGEDTLHTFNKAILSAKSNRSNVICVAVYDTFFDKIHNKIKKMDNLFLIVDEAHNISAKQYEKLPMHASFRLGLSATPEKKDVNLLNDILRYFLQDGQKPFIFDIEDAINKKILSEYEYFPIFVNLDVQELEQFKKLTQKISVQANMKVEDRDQNLIDKYANERSLILKKAKHKLDMLQEMIDGDIYNFKNSVVYCGQGKEVDRDEAIVDIVVKKLSESGLGISTYTSKTVNRYEVLRQFEEGYFDTLVAIKCFDEGVDVPKLDKIYIMASDRSIRQTVQRRGRVLRKCIESGKTIAMIYDFVVVPTSDAEYDWGYKKLLEIELSRVNEYLKLARNKNAYKQIVKDLEIKYDVKYLSSDREEE